VSSRLHLIGQSFGRLFVVDDGISKGGRYHYLCRCECGKTSRVLGTSLINGKTQSCGCLHAPHGAVSADRTEKQRAIHSSWGQMCTRCFNPSRKRFKDHGGRGIQVCAQWSLDFRFFWRDMEGSWFSGATIDRRDNNGHYNRHNCRWLSARRNSQNRRTTKLNGLKAAAIRLRAQSESSKSLAEMFGVSRSTVNLVIAGRVWKQEASSCQTRSTGGQL